MRSILFGQAKIRAPLAYPLMAALVVRSGLITVLGVGAIATQAPLVQASNPGDWRYNPDTNNLEVLLPQGSEPRYFLMAQPARIVVDLPNVAARNVTEKDYPGAIRQIRVAQFKPDVTRIVMVLSPDAVLAPEQVALQNQKTDTGMTRWVLRPVLAQPVAAVSAPAPPPATPTPAPDAAAPPDPAPPTASMDTPPATPTPDQPLVTVAAPDAPLTPPGRAADLEPTIPQTVQATVPEPDVAAVAPTPDEPDETVAPTSDRATPEPTPAPDPTPDAAPATTTPTSSVTAKPPTSAVPTQPYTPPTTATVTAPTSATLAPTVTVPPIAQPATIPVPAPEPSVTEPVATAPVTPAPVPPAPAAPTQAETPTPPPAIAAVPPPAPVPTEPEPTPPAATEPVPLAEMPAAEPALPTTPTVSVPDAAPAPPPEAPPTVVAVPPPASDTDASAPLVRPPVPEPMVVPSLASATGANNPDQPAVSVPAIDSVPADVPPSVSVPAPPNSLPGPSLPATPVTPAPPVAPPTPGIIDFGQPLPNASVILPSNTSVLPAGTLLSLRYPGNAPLKIRTNAPHSEALVLNNEIRDASGNLIVPAGSLVLGQFQTSSNGSRFVTTAISFNGQTRPLNAQSEPLPGSRQLSDTQMLQNSGIGAVAGGLISGFSGWGLLGGAAAGAAATYFTSPRPATIQPGQVITVQLLESWQ